MIVDELDVKDGYVKAEVHNHIATIEFFHPKGNSLPTKLLAKLTQEIDHISHDENTRVVLLRSEQHDVFCTGASLEEMIAITSEEDAVKYFHSYGNVINAMRKCSKLIVARIHGKCAGAGVGIAAAADYAIALEGAEVRLNELSYGFGPYVIAPALIRKMGLSAFSQIAIDSHLWRNADWARRKGIFAELHPNIESMEDSIERLTTSLSQNNTEANASLKKMLWEGTENWNTLLHERALTAAKLLLHPQTQKFLAGLNKSVVF
ncbi:enoyl-CoA hydratase [Arachidicoccus ginsenosidimutans]|uniref:enoyl-CoA hydratase/isomerase family protein n=1 Tax=Arachidicoccus sp. BS20 TaxID=1850526 RepID=UPI0007F15B96|nr:enoyl-CoA hydratase/isomerase family protein [Arachidicoccus sp. BS20]ANI90632.1 enoyl-CoA hydratase [Arachidicoccus sp. BS20]